MNRFSPRTFLYFDHKSNFIMWKNFAAKSWRQTGILYFMDGWNDTFERFFIV